MLLIVGVAFDHPVPRLHGLLAVGGVLLRVERSDVGSQLAEVVLAGFHRCSDHCEAGVRPYLVRRLWSRALVGLRTAEVHTRTDFALRRCFTVGTDDVRTAGVTVFGLRFGKTTLYVVNTIKILDFSHSSVFFTGLDFVDWSTVLLVNWSTGKVHSLKSRAVYDLLFDALVFLYRLGGDGGGNLGGVVLLYAGGGGGDRAPGFAAATRTAYEEQEERTDNKGDAITLGL